MNQSILLFEGSRGKSSIQKVVYDEDLSPTIVWDTTKKGRSNHPPFFFFKRKYASTHDGVKYFELSSNACKTRDECHAASMVV